MKVPKDVLAIALVLVVGVVALTLNESSSSSSPPPDPEQAVAHAAAPDHIAYRVEGGASGMRFVEVEIDGPGEALIRYRPRGGATMEVHHPWPEARHSDLVRLLADVRFFETEEVGRKGYYPEIPRVTLRARLGGREHEVVIDGRTRPSLDLDRLIASLDAIRLAATPEALASGD